MAGPPRKYDILILGATGYTGKLTTHFIAQQLPGDLRWAIAGRSKAKLHDLAAELRVSHPDRSQPTIEIVDLERKEQVEGVVQQARVCISVVSYWTVGTTVVDACVRHRTDYIDTSSGDIPLIQFWINKYHETAKASGVALIHACGVFAGPEDLLSWAAARELKDSFGESTKEVVLAVKELTSDPSGGTFHSILQGEADQLQIDQAQESRDPWYLSPIKGTTVSPQTNMFHLRKDPDLGLLSDSTVGILTNRAIVHRTWGLLQGSRSEYGPNFQYNEYQSVKSTLGGLSELIKSSVIETLMSSPLLLRLLSLFMPAPGSGPDVKQAEKIPVKLQAMAKPENESSPKVFASFSYPSGSYHTTALFLGQAAASLLYTKSLEGGLTGGCLTPATLGPDFLERIRSSGATITLSSTRQ
ncbi:unnamed protein product [Clonostachys solani]|uniref:Saccharopine dehydrogenase NADP binding domain-containing protein n=1 Tax=Clonostachys solani TaxID=160281 RepID=A0A9P0ELY9_9HYPO|nr:unnamed protein product [Clonostachys solani]